MKKSNISKIIKMFLSARFPSETEEKVQKWIIKDENQQAKAKASLDYWNELDIEADSSTYASLERVNLRTGYSSTSEEDLIAKELEMLIDELVGGMPEQRRMIYTLSRNEGLSNAEIAERLNTTKRNVESQLSLALKEIRKVISCFLVSLL